LDFGSPGARKMRIILGWLMMRNRKEQPPGIGKKMSTQFNLKNSMRPVRFYEDENMVVDGSLVNSRAEALAPCILMFT